MRYISGVTTKGYEAVGELVTEHLVHPDRVIAVWAAATIAIDLMYSEPDEDGNVHYELSGEDTKSGNPVVTTFGPECFEWSDEEED